MNPEQKKVRVLMVCLGNICRSPTAHGVFQKRVENAGLGNIIEVDSAGTGDWHIGREPDPRACSAAQLRGYDLSPLRARQVHSTDFESFDYILAMDEENLRNLRALCPPQYHDRLQLFLHFAGDDVAPRYVPDPYYGEEDGFQLVLDLVEDGADALLNHIKRHHL